MTGRGMGYCVLKISDEDTLAPPLGQDVHKRSGQETETSRETGKVVITMPAGNGTGPLGMGPMTGRAAGYCAGYPVPGYVNPGLTPGVAGRGFLAGPFVGAYAPAPYAQGVMPFGYGAAYGYGAGYAPVWPRPFGWFGRGWGRGFGRGRGRGRW